MENRYYLILCEFVFVFLVVIVDIQLMSKLNKVRFNIEFETILAENA